MDPSGPEVGSSKQQLGPAQAQGRPIGLAIYDKQLFNPALRIGFFAIGPAISLEESTSGLKDPERFREWPVSFPFSRLDS